MGDVVTTVSLLGALRARAGAWSTWRGPAVSWAGKAIAETEEKPVEAVQSAPVEAAKPVESTPEKPAAAVVPPAPAPIPAAFTRPVRKPARAVPQGPSLFDRLQETAPEKRSAS